MFIWSDISSYNDTFGALTLFLKVPTTNSEKDAMSEGTQLYIIFQNQI